MRVQVLMSTMNLKKENDLPIGVNELIKTKVKCSIINQCPNANASFFINKPDIAIHSISQTGLSKSRNQNLSHLREQIGLISDQDIRYKKGFEQVIENAFHENQEADIIAFQIENEQGGLYKNYRKNAKWLNQRDIMRVSSVEIAFKAKSIKNNNLNFDENFGLGSTFPTGEETIFLSDALKKRLKIRYVPQPIVVHSNNSSGGQFMNNESLIRAKGAMFYRIFGVSAYAISILFAIKKYKMSSETLLNFVTLMFKGISSYKELAND